MNPGKFFSIQEQEQIKQAIKQAELATSGEIRIHLEGNFKGDVLDRAAYLFRKLNMHKTSLRNGVLIYLALENRQFAIIGDAGINSKVPEDFWDKIKDEMQTLFSKGEFARALCGAVEAAGSQLQEHFPFKKDDINELSDEISYGKS